MRSPTRACPSSRCRTDPTACAARATADRARRASSCLPASRSAPHGTPTSSARSASLIGTEARRKGAHIVLGPTVNLHRTPVGGRTFECYSEDPELTGALAAAYVRGVQSHDVAVTVKHFAANDTEIERMSVDVDVDERTLRELYLRPFERTVNEADAWGIMSAYNRLDGDFCAHNRRLLTDILRDEWGFDGFVVSDWYGVHDAAGAANAGLSLEMPGPVRIYGNKLVAAVERGDVDEAQVDRLVRDLLVLANRTKADERSADDPEQSVDDPAERALTRRAAIGGTVLLRNEPVGGAPVLPFDAATIRSIAVVGPNASIDRCMGGGSASLTPFGHRTLLAAITDAFGPGTAADATITYEPGVRIDRLTPVVRKGQLVRPDGEPGLRVSYVERHRLGRRGRRRGDVVDVARALLRLHACRASTLADSRRASTGAFVPDVDGPHTIGIVTTGPVSLAVDAGDGMTTIVDDPDMELPRSEEFFGYGSIEVTETIECRAGVPVPVAVKWSTAAGNGFAAIRLGVRSPEPADLMDRAVAAAAAADIAVVMVGTNDEWETEGHDRTTMDLPGRQDELVRRVVAANPRTAVIVNAGSPVTMDWAADDDPNAGPGRAHLVLRRPGAGRGARRRRCSAIADPGGRLPTTYPQAARRPPRLRAPPARPRQHRRRHPALRRGSVHGLPRLRRPRPRAALRVRSRPQLRQRRVGRADRVGDRDRSRRTVAHRHGAGQPQPAPATPPSSCRDTSRRSHRGAKRPPKELKAWAKSVVAAGTTRGRSMLEFGPDAFHHWDAATRAWIVEPGDYDLVIASSAGVEHARIRITVTA